MRKKLSQTYFRLFTGELCATILFAYLWVTFMERAEWGSRYLTSPLTVSAFLLLEFILLQGTFYWYIKWKQAKRGVFTPLSKGKRLFFLICKRINLYLLIVGLLVLLYIIFTRSIYVYWFALLYLFAAVEYINYYYIRLSYQSPSELKELRSLLRNRKLRASKLSQELNV